MEYFFVFIFGIIFGSFLNVCIYRIPLNKSIVYPRSFCPFCEKPIGWFDNVPLVSFMFLRGKSRCCKKPIPIRYFIVELIAAFTGIICFFYFGLTSQFFVYWFFTLALVAISFIDIEHQEIPDVISIPGIILGIVLMTFFHLDGSDTLKGSLLNSGLGILAGGGSMFLLGVFGELIFRKEALGGGDVKLLAMTGAFLGWKLALLTFFLAPLLGSGSALVAKIKLHKEVLPYGPYISLGAFVSLLYGNKILGYIFGF